MNFKLNFVFPLFCMLFNYLNSSKYFLLIKQLKMLNFSWMKFIFSFFKTVITIIHLILIFKYTAFMKCVFAGTTNVIIRLTDNLLITH
jgi:hypothetical protein